MRIGLLGAGLIGGEHSAGLRDLLERGLVDGCLAGVHDPAPGRAEAFRARFGFERVFPAAEALLEAPEVEVIFVTSWTAAHAPAVELAARLGKPVFCEKPLGRTLAEARGMHAAVRRARLPHQLGLILRTSPALQQVRALCREPALGRLMAVHLRDDQFFPIQGRYQSEWRKDQALAGGGTLIEHSIHDVDLVRWLFGDFREVRARLGNHAGHPGIEDLALVQAELAGGGQASFLSLWHQITSRPSTRRLEIFFERGRIEVEDEVLGPVSLELGDAPKRVLEQAEVARHYLQANPALLPLGLQVASPQEVEDYLFLRALGDGRPPAPDFAEGVAAHEIVEAAYLSAREDRLVRLPLA
jgi:predicted dehydrogenase